MLFKHDRINDRIIIGFYDDKGGWQSFNPHNRHENYNDLIVLADCISAMEAEMRAATMAKAWPLDAMMRSKKLL